MKKTVIASLVLLVVISTTASAFVGEFMPAEKFLMDSDVSQPAGVLFSFGPDGDAQVTYVSFTSTEVHIHVQVDDKKVHLVGRSEDEDLIRVVALLFTALMQNKDAKAKMKLVVRTTSPGDGAVAITIHADNMSEDMTLR